MKIKKVNQYKCDFCGKKKYSASAMKKHERHCTKNINRECRICEKGGTTSSLKAIVEVLPRPKYLVCDYEGGSYDNFFELDVDNGNEINEIIKNVKNSGEYCPMCLFSALRIKGINPKATEFNYEAEMKSFWADYNLGTDPGGITIESYL